METIYLDELFVLNLVIDYFLLLATAKICALPYRRGRFLLAGAAGALWCCLALVPELGFLQQPGMELVLAAVMTLCAFGRERWFFRCMLAFLGVSALFGGAVYAGGLALAPAGRDRLLIHLDMRVLVLSFAVCWALVSLVFRRSAKDAQRRVYAVSVTQGGRTVAFHALADTGNSLYDPLSGRSVLVAEADTIAPLYDPESAQWLSGDPLEAVEHVPGLRLVPYGDVSGHHRLLAAFRPQTVTVDGADRDDLLVAITPACLDGHGSYQAIL
jgi:stage II sporulation protein GA (sporulation sigma-E factor processing peptidase)